MPIPVEMASFHRRIYQLQKEMFQETATRFLDILSSAKAMNDAIGSRNLLGKHHDYFSKFDENGYLHQPIGKNEVKRLQFEAENMGLTAANDIEKIVFDSVLFEAGSQVYVKHAHAIMTLIEELGKANEQRPSDEMKMAISQAQGLVQNPQIMDIGELFKLVAIKKIIPKDKLFEEEQVSVFKDEKTLIRLIAEKKPEELLLDPVFAHMFKSKSHSDELFIKIHLSNLAKRLAEAKKAKDMGAIAGLAREYMGFVTDHMQYIPQSENILKGLKGTMETLNLLESKQKVGKQSVFAASVENEKENIAPTEKHGFLHELKRKMIK